MIEIGEVKQGGLTVADPVGQPFLEGVIEHPYLFVGQSIQAFNRRLD